MKLTAQGVKARRYMVMNDINTGPHKITDNHVSVRNYGNGDIRCTNCKKWINPMLPWEAKEIRYTKGGRRIHHEKYCSVKSAYMAAFVTTPRIHGKRRRGVDNAKRY